MNKFFAGGVAFAVLAGSSVAASAQSGPVVLANGLYFSVDGGWERVHLPAYTLGIRNNASAVGGFVDLGIANSFTQRFDGYNIRGTIGYMISANARVEVGVRYAHASNTQNAVAAQAGGGSTVAFLDGTRTTAVFNCNGTTFTCSVGSTQATNYSNWLINGKVAADTRIGALTLTPSVGIFGGHARANQSLAQAFSQVNAGVVTNTGSYNASTSLGWTDLGVRLGLNGDFDVNPWLTVGLGGSVGFARRHASLSGSDAGADSSAVFIVFDGATAISSSANTTALLANVETHATIKWTQSIAFRAFAGLNFDSSIPGVSSPTWSLLVPVQPPSGIVFSGQTSYYGGGGVSVRF